jgi:hypothetical protein
MAEEQTSQMQSDYELVVKIRDLEESQKMMRERLLLISQNFLEAEEKNIKEIETLKKQIILIESDIKRIKDMINSMILQVSKSARKEEIDLLRKQSKIFEPLNYVRMEDLDSIIEEKMRQRKK